MSGETPRYATLLYEVRRVLDVSFTEYVYLDMVHKLSYDRWCNKSLENCADDLGITKRGMLKMKNRLIERGLLKKNDDGYLKVTDKYIKAAVNSVPKAGNLVPKTGELSSPKNNNRNTENFKKVRGTVEKPVDKVGGRGQYSPAKERLRKMFESKRMGEQLTITGG